MQNSDHSEKQEVAFDEFDERSRKDSMLGLQLMAFFVTIAHW